MSDRPQESILAAIQETAQTWCAQTLLNSAYEATRRQLIYKRLESLERVLHRLETEERWARLRVLIVSRKTLFDAIDPATGTTTSQPPLLTKIRDKYQFAINQLIVIGISTNDMYGTLLSRMGCDKTCDPDDLLSALIEQLS